MTTQQAHEGSDTIVLPLPRLSPRAGARKPQPPLRTPDEGLPLAQLSALLWAGFGLDRRGSGGRTITSRHQHPGVDLYAVLPAGTYRYDALEHRLLQVTRRDLRGCIGPYATIPQPLLTLAYATDCTDAGEDAWEECGRLAGAGAQCVAGNIAAYCASAGLAAAVRHVVSPRLAQELRLPATQRIVMSQAIGPAGAAH